MKKTEWFTIIISLIALAMSTFAIYLEFFYVKQRISASADDISNREQMSYVDLAISNDGDRQIMVTNIHFFLVGKDVNSFEDAQYRTSVGTFVEDIYSDFALPDVEFALAAGDTVIVRLRSSFDFSHPNYPDYFRDSSFNIGIEFEVYTSGAQKREFGIVPFWANFSEGLPDYPSRRHDRSERRRSWDL